MSEHVSQTDRRLMMRESFARHLALLVILLIVLLLVRTIPENIDYDSPGQMLYLGQLQGLIGGMGLSACTFFFFIQASERNARDGQRPNEAAPLVSFPSPTPDQTLTATVSTNHPKLDEEPKL